MHDSHYKVIKFYMLKHSLVFISQTRIAFLYLQSTLSISTTLYLDYLSISNLCLGPLMDTLGYFYFSISNFLYLEQNFWSLGSSR